MASTPISKADRATHLEFLRTLDGPGRKRFFTAYNQHTALQTVYGLITDDATEAVPKRWLRSKMTKVVQEYANSERYEMIQKVFSDLPFELQYMIYGNVWDAKTVTTAFDKVKSTKLRSMPWLKSCNHKSCACFQPHELPLYAQHQFVGLEMAREVAKAYYKAMHPERLGYRIEHLRAFLTTDHFHLGIVPAEHIRHIRITLCPRKNPKLGMIEEEEIDDVCWSDEGLQLIQESLTALDLIPMKAGFRFTVVLGDDVVLNRTTEVMDAMRSSYEKFTQAGMHFRVYGYPEFEDSPILRIDRYFGIHNEFWYDFTDAMYRRKYHPLESPSDDDAPNEAAWLNRASDEMERRGYAMIEFRSLKTRIEWLSIIRREPA